MSLWSFGDMEQPLNLLTRLPDNCIRKSARCCPRRGPSQGPMQIPFQMWEEVMLWTLYSELGCLHRK